MSSAAALGLATTTAIVLLAWSLVAAPAVIESCRIRARVRRRVVPGSSRGSSQPLVRWLQGHRRSLDLFDGHRWAMYAVLPQSILALGVLTVFGIPMFAFWVTVMFVLSRVVLQIARERRALRYRRTLPMALDAMARSLRSGSGLLDALREASVATPGEVGVDLRLVVRETSMGQGISESMRRWAERRPIPSVYLIVATMSMVMESGGAQARAVDSVGSTLRQQLQATEGARTHATQARASAWVLTLLPVGIALLTLGSNPAARRFLLHSPIGFVVLCAGAALDGLGAWWMSRLIRRATP